MTTAHTPVRITATAAARSAAQELHRTASEPVLLLLRGDEPLCAPLADLYLEDDDRRAAVVAGCPVYVARALDARATGVLEIDVAPGDPELPSLPAGPHRHFVVKERHLDPCTAIFPGRGSCRGRQSDLLDLSSVTITAAWVRRTRPSLDSTEDT